MGRGLSWLLCATVLMLALDTNSAAPYPAHAQKPSFVAVGDGLTESAFSSDHMGWGLLMQQQYTRKADIINRGYGGFFTSWFVDYMLDTLFDVANPTLAILFLGVKDSLTPAVAKDHYISPQQFGQNIQAIIDAAKEAGVTNFLIITPPPVCEACKAKSPRPWDRENNHTALYVDQLQQLASNNSAAFLDIFTSWQQDPNWHETLLLPDKLHLSPAGNERLFNEINSVLEKELPDLAPANIPLNYPLMDVISKDDPAAAFDLVVQAPTSKKTLPGSGLQERAADRSGSSGGADSATIAVPATGGATSAAAGLSAAVGGSGWLVITGVALAAWQLLAA